MSPPSVTAAAAGTDPGGQGAQVPMKQRHFFLVPWLILSWGQEGAKETDRSSHCGSVVNEPDIVSMQICVQSLASLSGVATSCSVKSQMWLGCGVAVAVV